MQCGKIGSGVFVCGPGQSCSRWNWCGVGGLFASTQQAEYSNNPGKACTHYLMKNTLKCMVGWGKCGNIDGKLYTCQKGLFCSRWGWCGAGTAYESGHQVAYSDNKLNACG